MFKCTYLGAFFISIISSTNHLSTTFQSYSHCKSLYFLLLAHTLHLSVYIKMIKQYLPLLFIQQLIVKEVKWIIFFMYQCLALKKL